VDLEHLERELTRHEQRPLKIGSFSAASNVTGIESDTRAIAGLLHRHGALSFWDYAAAGPYLDIAMNPAPDARGGPAHKDAIFLSPHKFVGGPGTPGVLVVKRDLLRNRVPTVPGGGTVAYVNPNEHRYLEDPVQREEGGTPAIVESIRAGLVFQLKQAVGTDLIRAREESFIHRAIASWERNPKLTILGNREARRLSIVSFVVHHGAGYLHHNYVVALLNDLFGIQARGGCSCAGPYGHRLLGIDLTTSHEFEREILRGHEGVKPGWVRVSFNYFLSEAVFEFLIEAVHLVADRGWTLLPHYRFVPDTGLWFHAGASHEAAMRLTDVSYASGRMEYESMHSRIPEAALAGHIEQARRIFDDALRQPPPAPHDPQLSADFEHLRWFPLPGEARAEIAGRDEPHVHESIRPR
jgi:selenocysteine lyase/cysteine desulfurase